MRHQGIVVIEQRDVGAGGARQRQVRGGRGPAVLRGVGDHDAAVAGGDDPQGRQRLLPGGAIVGQAPLPMRIGLRNHGIGTGQQPPRIGVVNSGENRDLRLHGPRRGLAPHALERGPIRRMRLAPDDVGVAIAVHRRSSLDPAKRRAQAVRARVPGEGPQQADPVGPWARLECTPGLQHTAHPFILVQKTCVLQLDFLCRENAAHSYRDDPRSELQRPQAPRRLFALARPARLSERLGDGGGQRVDRRLAGVSPSGAPRRGSAGARE